jgi:hypothetical protein
MRKQTKAVERLPIAPMTSSKGKEATPTSVKIKESQPAPKMPDGDAGFGQKKAANPFSEETGGKPPWV